MYRFFGMMPRNEIDKEETFIDENNYKVTIQAGCNGYTIIYADGSSQYEDITCSTEENFNKAFRLAESSVGKLTRTGQVSEER